MTAEALDYINKVAKLGWVHSMDDKFYMQLEDVEKLVEGLLDKNYMDRIDSWVKESGKPVKEATTPISPIDYNWLKHTVKTQSEILGKLLKGEQCVFKEGCCPFKDKQTTPDADRGK